VFIIKLNDLKEKVDELVELIGVGNLEIYKYGSSMYAEKVNNALSVEILYRRDFYPLDKEDHRYRHMSESEIGHIFINGERVIRLR